MTYFLSLSCKYQDTNESEVFRIRQWNRPGPRLSESMQALGQGQVFCSAQDLWVNAEHSSEPSYWGCGALWRCVSSGCSSLHAIGTTSRCILKIGTCGEPFVHSTLCSHSCDGNVVRPPGFATWIFQEMQEMKLSHVTALQRAVCNKTWSPQEWQWHYCTNWLNLFIC